MIRSKYLGQSFGSWTVTKVQIAGRYGKRNKVKGNTYQFTLTKPTKDEACDKSLVINHNDMVALSRGLTTVEAIEARQAKYWRGYANSAFYRFFEA